MNIYRDEIIEHYNNPQNFGRLKHFSNSSRQTNPFCGDDIELFIEINKDKKIKNIGFIGTGCAISVASASILTEFVRNKSIIELSSFQESDMMHLLEIEVSETRKKCALLAWATLQNVIKKYE